jgi:Tfp pilus assembly protein FimT
MTNKEWGFSTLELFVGVAVISIVASIALPQAFNSINYYRLHRDASQVAGYLNVERMRAASQGAPYALDVNASNYAIEQLTPLPYDPLGTPSTITYTSQSPAVYDFGTQYLAPGDTVTNCRPSGVSVYPTPVIGDPSTCGTPFQIYFNTRGLPVDVHGSALSSTGGVAVYLMSTNPSTNTISMIDAVTVSAGGAVQVWNWSPSTSAWALR